jgi:uncharacterized protein (TIGR04222 family)
MNPLDWTAIPFLRFYIVLSISAVLIILVLKRMAKGSADPLATSELNFLELAYLSGGFQRMADTVTVALMTAGAATYTAKGRVLSIDPTDAKLPRELEPLREHLTGVTTRADFTRALRPWLEKTRAHLVQRGLALHPDRLRLVSSISLVLIAIPVMLGLAKMGVGLDRHRPIGFLAILTIILLFVGLRLTLRAPRSTAAGDKALEDSRLRYARLSRAPLNNEMSLAFAIAGAAVLVGTPYSAFGQTAQSSGGGGSCGGGSGCGGGGGGGCGGCGGH